MVGGGGGSVTLPREFEDGIEVEDETLANPRELIP
jgi:hypothetical protein